MNLKPFLSIEEQLDLLKARGLVIDDEHEALLSLHRLNYYRLSGYTLTLRKGDSFFKNVKFSDVLQIYSFDRELKELLLHWLEDVEIGLRTHVGYVLGRLGPTSYLNSDYFASTAHFEAFQSELSNALNDGRNEAFVKHHKTKYGGVLPCWAIVETFSFGTLSRLFSNLDVNVKKEICEIYYQGIRYTYIENWLESLVVVRNMCAHHSRLFNRGLPSAVKFGKDDFKFLRDIGYDSNSIGKKIFFVIIVLDRIEHGGICHFTEGLSLLQDKYSFVDLKHYGFPQNWLDTLSRMNDTYYGESIIF